MTPLANLYFRHDNPQTVEWLHLHDKVDKNTTIKELCAVQSKSPAVTYIFQLGGQWTSSLLLSKRIPLAEFSLSTTQTKTFMTQSGDYYYNFEWC